jgi:hypothetical protein
MPALLSGGPSSSIGAPSSRPVRAFQRRSVTSVPVEATIDPSALVVGVNTIASGS